MRALAVALILLPLAAARAEDLKAPPWQPGQVIHGVTTNCPAYARAAYGLAHDRNMGRLDQTEAQIWAMKLDPAVLAISLAMIEDLEAFPAITPEEAARMSMEWCGWKPQSPGALLSAEELLSPNPPFAPWKRSGR